MATVEIYCAICKYYNSHRCKLWEVKITDPDDAHCESCQIKK